MIPLTSPKQLSATSVLWLSLVMLPGITGCSPSSNGPAASNLTGTRAGVTASPRQAAATGENFGSGVARPAMERVTNRLVQAEIILQGRIPYDNMSLPLVSPDGRYIATQSRISPTWPTILAEYDADVPQATRIEIYQRPAGEGQVSFVAAVNEPAILGRSYDDGGFLIESPREDGSRWIGYVSWEGGSIDWLVADEMVNAFPTLGADGRLAWSRRPIYERDDHFELVVRRHGQEWTIESPYESWLMPGWSGRGDGLFVFSLADSHLELVHGIAADEIAFRQSVERIGLARNASVISAYQAVTAQSSSPTLAPSGRERIAFYHPSRLRMAIWEPRTGRHGSVTLLHRNSFAALIDGDRALVTTERNLLLQRISQPTDLAEFLAGTMVARPINDPDWPYVLLGTADGTITIVAMRPFVPADAAAR